MFLYAKEREARIAAEKQRDEQRQRFEEQRREDLRRFDEQLQEERRRSEAWREEERQRCEEDRRRSEEIHQAMLSALSALTDKITELAGPNRADRR